MPLTTGLQNVSARAGGDAPEDRLHVAIIMDGNGRWAKQRGMPRVLGHRAGVNALKRTVEGAQSQNVGVLTVFGFSTENWRRPAHEVSELMSLLKAYVESDLERLARAGVRVRIIGRRTGLSADLAEVIERAEQRTAQNSDFTLQVAFNYGGQADLTDAARAFAEAAVRGEVQPADLTEATFERYLSTAAAPAPDLIVRTSGERRISNFLLWECAYAELIFQDVLWPDYGPEALAAAIAEYRRRDRRYGGIAADDVAVAG
ncbi:polyprenyl diphosphate synthase [Caulobacter sp. RHG1]|uniref:polyprenyl diphosphate synthase n=1 Tax=Caulobacter sp. (strain RHG1) TaxID=2545762 RepID=UPI00155526CF|nr:polyprenyl diphosphate synthase [Caulobacter sp. RHG1]NQE64133.1 Undecaprenyl diphosphate synthase [Caulobacter sp. RHG1]